MIALSQNRPKLTKKADQRPFRTRPANLKIGAFDQCKSHGRDGASASEGKAMWLVLVKCVDFFHLVGLTVWLEVSTRPRLRLGAIRLASNKNFFEIFFYPFGWKFPPTRAYAWAGIALPGHFWINANKSRWSKFSGRKFWDWLLMLIIIDDRSLVNFSLKVFLARCKAFKQVFGRLF